MRIPSIAVLLLTASFGAASIAAAPDVDPLLYKPAPTFIRNDLNHQPVDLGASRGHVVLLSFWATWCAPCQLEMPRFIEWQQKFGPQGLQIVGVAMDDAEGDHAPAAVIATVRQRKVNYPIVMGDEKLGTLYGGILGLPVTYLIDRQGIVVAKFKGEGNLDSMERKIQELLRR